MRCFRNAVPYKSLQTATPIHPFPPEQTQLCSIVLFTSSS